MNMKKHLLFLCFALFTLSTFSQSSIPNGNFEQWTSSTFENPQYYPVSSNIDNFFYFQLPFNVTKTTDSYHGAFAVQLTTVANTTDTSAAYFINASPNSDPSAWTGGMAINEKPSGIRGYYKYNVATADSATIIIAFSKSGVNIGTYMYTMGGIHTSYNLFDFTFTPALTLTPDSVIFAALSCKLTDSQQGPTGLAGSTLLIDSVSFKGVTSQPAEMNGDFELWQNQTYDNPTSWYLQNDRGEGFNKSTDAAGGNFALELTTYLGNQNNQPIARSGRASTGYYPNNCNGGCYQQGGYPFSNQIDTLVFSYKYLPSGIDTASIHLSFKNNHVYIDGMGMNLFASSGYQYVELPLNLFQTPDSVIIDIQSSSWGDSALSFVGSNLIIDEIHFKSQSLGTNIISNFVKKNAVSFYPNPFKTTATIEINSSIDILETELIIVDITGKEVKIIPVDKYKIVVNKEELKSGLYFYKLRKYNKSLSSGKFIIE